MNILTAMRERLDRLAVFAELDVEPATLPSGVAALSDASVVEVLREVTAIANDAGRLQSIVAGVAAQRSRRGHGHSGLAATHGHASPVALVQSITGGTRADALRQVRVGQALLEDGAGGADAGHGAGPGETGAGGTDAERRDGAAGGGAAGGGDADCGTGCGDGPWHAPLQAAVWDGRLTTSQHDAIRGGLGEPEAEGVDAASAALAWKVAAETLIDEAVAKASVEELHSRARQLRDILDPVGAETRFQERYEKRSLRMWIDHHGQHHGHLVLDDEMALWLRTTFAAALRPRRGAARFVTDDERGATKDLSDDPRSKEQLEYDVFVDLVRAGALANAADVFGARQPGVRVVVVEDASGPRDPIGRLVKTGHAEDGGDPLPGSVVDRNICMNGIVTVTVDSCGNPLDVGHEQRLFTPKQRIALAIRDGGCIGAGCARPASYCEAHHIDHVGADNGRTDIDRGVLLCRFHHMQLHNNGWKIVREGHGAFVLVPPPGHRDPGGGLARPYELRSKAPWAWAWDPPPPPRRPRAAPVPRTESIAQ